MRAITINQPLMLILFAVAVADVFKRTNVKANIKTYRRRNGRGNGGHGPLTFQSKLFLKSYLSFLNTILYGKRFTRTRKAEICVEIHLREVSFYSR